MALRLVNEMQLKKDVAAAPISSPPLPPSPNLTYLLALQSLTSAHYNTARRSNPALSKANPLNDSSQSQVTSSDEVLVGKRSSNRSSDKYLEEKKYQCNYCGDSFGYKHVLQNHVRIHTGEKPYKCPEPKCGKKFTRDHHLKTHMRLHTGEKPFECDYCDKRFVQVANLRRHLQIHTGVRAKCNIKLSPAEKHQRKDGCTTSPDIMNEKVDDVITREPLYQVEYYKYMACPRLQEEQPEDLSLKSDARVI